MSDFRRDEMTDSEVDESWTPKRKCVERIDMIRKSEYDELVREHLETRAEIAGLEQQITQIQAQYQAKLKATEEALIKANSQETALYVEAGELRVLVQQCTNALERISQCESCQAKTDTIIRDINAQLGKRDARDDAVEHWKKEVAAAREILDSCRENTNYWMEVQYKSMEGMGTRRALLEDAHIHLSALRTNLGPLWPGHDKLLEDIEAEIGPINA